MNELSLDSPISTETEVRRELKRKTLHLPGLMVPWFGHYWPRTTLISLAVLSLIYYLSELRRLSDRTPLPLFGYLSARLTRHQHLDLAPIFLALGLGIASYYLPFRAALAGALLVCVCDAFAAMVGMKFGSWRIFGLKKTYLGTLAFFISAVLVLIPFLDWRWALVTAGTATLIEAISIEGIDNLLLPIIGGIMVNRLM